ncbi:sigma 54-interacting transcriptional regulator [Sandaracinus amylolyticus]|uniref:Response regulator of zinc sigma-54-dependent two-component system n=1 Tax=Sandaracinus amylolyticus TaxID=927083 RepID=A0A0F6SGI4_9BACT|nr:sigma 54-interacting transcriptional regulator [Sandaracinus amylolyticus]AKF08749.1 Response regulator of zinc sigma-54-dependent two-component system [Sandaracinus amylolyticus]
MSAESTVPRRTTAQPVRSVRARIVAGPDAGRVAALEDERIGVGTAEGNALRVADRTVSRYHLELRREGARIEVRDLGSTNGTHIGPVLVRHGVVSVAPGTEIALGDTRLVLEDGEYVVQRLAEGDQLGGLRGKSRAMRRLYAEIDALAQSDVSVLLVGESGTGKELVARALHDLGPRAQGPFVTVDATTLVPTLYASELYGHERGAFTGADRRHVGAFERAQGGTLFLDEIGEVPAPLQAGLLGALERRSIRRVGGRDEIAIDVRVVAATHRDLRAAVNAGTFRLDLYYRLAVVALEVPPLRERASDIPLLIEHFLREAGYEGRVDALFPPDVLAALGAHGWPGNVRELRNAVERAIALGMPPESIAPHGSDDVDALFEGRYREARRAVLDDFERRYLARLLERTGGNVRAAAREAELDRTYLTDLLKRHGLKP